MRATRSRALVLATAISLGTLVGVSGYTLRYAEAFSYLSTDSAACANCHIMQPQYDSWQRASHRQVAGCADCHLPWHGLEKWLSKADNGYRHSVAFTLQNFHEPIQMTEGNRRTLQANCLECHGAVAHALTTQPDALACVHCHQTVGHGPRAALGGALAPDADEVSDE